MRIVQDFPPNWDAILAAFPKAAKRLAHPIYGGLDFPTTGLCTRAGAKMLLKKASGDGEG